MKRSMHALKKSGERFKVVTEYNVTYSSVALDDIEQAWDEIYSASMDYDTADKYIDELRVKINNISKHPRTGKRLTYEGIFTGIYYVTHKKYSAFYRIGSGRIEVGRVLYNRSDYLKLIIESMGE